MGTTKSKTFRLPYEIVSRLEDLAKTENKAEAFIVSKSLEEFFAPLKKKKEETLTLDLTLQAVLGAELHKRHIDFLESYRQEGESLEDVFCRFIERAGIQITKEEWKQRIQEGEKVDHFKVLDPSPCHYRAITESGEWYCDTKKIPPAVCIKRQERHEYTNRRCKPIRLSKVHQMQRIGRIIIPKTTYCYVKKEKVSIKEVCYNPENPCEKRTYCRSLDHYKQQLEKARLKGQI